MKMAMSPQVAQALLDDAPSDEREEVQKMIDERPVISQEVLQEVLKQELAKLDNQAKDKPVDPYQMWKDMVRIKAMFADLFAKLGIPMPVEPKKKEPLKLDDEGWAFMDDNLDYSTMYQPSTGRVAVFFEGKVLEEYDAEYRKQFLRWYADHGYDIPEEHL